MNESSKPDAVLSRFLEADFHASIARQFEAIVASSSSTTNHNRDTRFDGKARPAISLLDYLRRMATYSKCSSVCLIAASCYIATIVSACSSSTLFLHPLNIHRLLLVAVMLAAKFYDDDIYKNTLWARVGGIPLTELSRLEMDFLLLMDWKLLVPKETLAETAKLLEEGRFSIKGEEREALQGSTSLNSSD
jgi:hypothetical protein